MKNKYVKQKFLCFAVLAVAFARLVVLSAAQETVSGAETKKVVLGGQTIGIKLYADGIHVLKLSDVETADGLKEPAKKAGIKKGDYITHVNGVRVTSYEQFSALIQNQNEVLLTVSQNGEKQMKKLKPAVGKDGVYRAGIWVRDSTAGIGTVTFLDSATKTAGALGHGITDPDTGVLLIGSGRVYKASVASVSPAKDGVPGELNGNFAGEEGYIGSLIKNTDTGAFFSVTDCSGTEIPVAADEEVHEGAAFMYSTIDGTEVKPYTVRITKIIRSSIFSSKGMLIEVTDPFLLKKTGGILCGMSGSPLVQDGRLVGAVTHVFLNNSTKGYAVSIGSMLDKTEMVKQ